MADKRDLILNRTAAILAELTAAGHFISHARNRGLIQQDGRPHVLLLDGDEETRLHGDRRGRVVSSVPQLMTMRPQIFVLLKDKKPQNENVGQELNEKRRLLIRSLCFDPDLIALVGANGSILYDRMETDLKNGSTLDGSARLDFLYTYSLDPTAL